MGTSFTRFNGFGFWSRDGYVAAWMGVLVSEMDQIGELSPTQQAFRDDLILQASLQITGAVSDCLEHVARSEPLRVWAVSVGKQALDVYVASGDVLDGRWLNRLMQAKGSVDTGSNFVDEPIPSDGHIKYGEKWLNLLEGEFLALPLLPSGRFHGTGDIEVDVVARGSAKTKN